MMARGPANPGLGTGYSSTNLNSGIGISTLSGGGRLGGNTASTAGLGNY